MALAHYAEHYGLGRHVPLGVERNPSRDALEYRGSRAHARQVRQDATAAGARGVDRPRQEVPDVIGGRPAVVERLLPVGGTVRRDEGLIAVPGLVREISGGAEHA